MQKIVATNPSKIVPVVFPEGMLFPSIFYKDDGCGSIIGALPCGTLAHYSTLKIWHRRLAQSASGSGDKSSITH
jgi:hypothetical protein